jgi:hypothetical protein
VFVRDGQVIGSGYNMTNHSRNVSPLVTAISHAIAEHCVAAANTCTSSSVGIPPVTVLCGHKRAIDPLHVNVEFHMFCLFPAGHAAC